MVVVCSNQDVLTEILLRLPVKPLLRFKCVSKQWLSLITDPNFCSSHTQIKKSRPNSLLITNNNSVYQKTELQMQLVPLLDGSVVPRLPSLDYLNQDGVCILDSCNGLILCSSVPEKQIYVCNPATKQFKTLVYLGPGSYNLAFDPHKSPRFEVIWVSISPFERRYRVRTYLSQTNSWNSVREFVLDYHDIFYGDGVYSNGGIHWCSQGQNSLSYGISNGRFKIVPVARNLGEHIMYFGESRGRLFMVRSDLDLTFKFSVLVMGGTDCSKWFLRSRVNFGYHGSDVVPGVEPFSILSIVEGEEKEDTKVVLLFDGRVISYSLYEKNRKQICDLKQRSSLSNAGATYFWNILYHWTYQYFETLVRV